jgi:hypothetical protein
LNLKQPILGIVAVFIVMTFSLGLISLFDFPTFRDWVAYGLLSIIPMEIVIGVTWGTKHPGFAARRPQPLQGILFVLVTAVVGAVVGIVHFFTVGGGIGPPTPMLSHAMIVSVVIAFWFAIMFGGWPFSSIKNPVAAGLTLLSACYVVNYLLFRVFYDYAFMADAPVYVASLDPGGMFNALSALVFYVTALSIMFLVLHFDLWPLTLSAGLMKQPVLGVVWTAIALALAGLVFYIGTDVMGMDVMQFLITVPIPFIFGSIVMLNMLQASVFRKLEQPIRGVASAVAAAVTGSVLARLYGVLAPVVTGELASGPPVYDLEIWLASALLSVTFPFLVFSADFFKMWPLQKAQSPLRTAKSPLQKAE